MIDDERAETRTSAVILAAGEGSRMRSRRAKPLAKLCGKTMIGHVIDALSEIPTLKRVVIVVGHQHQSVRDAVGEMRTDGIDISFVRQEHLRGTGDALAAALTALPDPLAESSSHREPVIVVPADTPLLRTETLQALVDSHRRTGAAATLLTADAEQPAGYGRIVRDRHGEIMRVVEDRDANESEALIREINTSCYVFESSVLAPSLRRLQPLNAQGEYYLTDVVEVLSSAGYGVGSVRLEDFSEVLGVNDRVQLAEAERLMRARINLKWMTAGVTIVDPLSTYIDAEVEIGGDTTIWPQTFLSGATAIAQNCEIGPGVRLVDCLVGEGAKIVRTEGEGAHFGEGCVVGPYVTVRAGAKIAMGREVGSFVILE
ncbi:MAG: bifunctional UDP-N-acetylglucosamine diphosphorylase/glucosamine-1-phosphate N-acetyltransferase GlmU [Acidimicrobiales bacterium]